MPRPLPDELLEEVLHRLPPHEPAELVRAALVSRRWCRLVSDPGFRRRFREFHCSPPMLGMLYNVRDDEIDEARFIPTCALCFRRTDVLDLRVLDARHGRVLFDKGGGSVLAVWEPIADEMRELPFPQKSPSPPPGPLQFSAPLLPAPATTLIATMDPSSLFLCAPAPDTPSSTPTHPMLLPISVHQNYYAESSMGSALVGNALYFGNVLGGKALKYDLELCRASLIRLPSQPLMDLLTTTEDGGLGLVNKEDSKLYLWSMKDTHEVDAKWERRVIELKTVFPADVVIDAELLVIGSSVGIIFMRMGDEVYTIDLKTYKVKKVYEGTAHNVVPYMSFYTPALKGTCTSDGEGPSAGHSSA